MVPSENRPTNSEQMARQRQAILAERLEEAAEETQVAQDEVEATQAEPEAPVDDEEPALADEEVQAEEEEPAPPPSPRVRSTDERAEEAARIFYRSRQLPGQTPPGLPGRAMHAPDAKPTPILEQVSKSPRPLPPLGAT